MRGREEDNDRPGERSASLAWRDSAVARRWNDAKKTAHLVRKTSQKIADWVFIKTMFAWISEWPQRERALTASFWPSLQPWRADIYHHCFHQKTPKGQSLSSTIIFMFFKVTVVFRQKWEQKKGQEKKPLKHQDETRAKFCRDRVDCAVIQSVFLWFTSEFKCGKSSKILQNWNRSFTKWKPLIIQRRRRRRKKLIETLSLLEWKDNWGLNTTFSYLVFPVFWVFFEVLSCLICHPDHVLMSLLQLKFLCSQIWSSCCSYHIHITVLIFLPFRIKPIFPAKTCTWIHLSPLSSDELIPLPGPKFFLQKLPS